jgi:dTDP-4-dehydrorhamnose 3,5-epimerase
MIQDVIFKDLKTFTDERGYFREIIRVTDDFFGEGFGQLSHSLVYAGTTKAWHIHQQQTDWWYVAAGVLKVALHDTRAGSPTQRETMEFLLGEDHAARAVRIPPGVAHGYRCVTGPASVIYVTSRVYDPADEGRIPHNDPGIGYDWLKGPEIT